MDVKSQKFLILGISKSGFSVGKYILKKGGKCFFYEELISDKIEEAENFLVSNGAIKLSTENVLEVLKNEIDVLIISPGVPINHEIAVNAKRLGKRIVGELEFGCLAYNPTNIAVTGTNGKTTTVNMIASILSFAELSYQLVGNVGTPITSILDDSDKNSILITEVSSFQLESVHSFCPHIACVLNISPDHLERHYNMENYVFLKRRILKNLTKSEYAILNYDDKIVRSFADDIKCNVIWVSSFSEQANVYSSSDGGLYFNGELIMQESQLMLKGNHNVLNALFAIASAKLIGIENDKIILGLNSFKGIKHRIEFVAEKNGVKFYNDSKATNTASSISAIESICLPIVLILGGSEKGEDYYALFNKIKQSTVKHTIITGASRYKMLETAGNVGCGNISVTEDFEYAIKIAKNLAEEGDVVLFSPACASFDNFKNYEERGNAFINIVESFS